MLDSVHPDWNPLFHAQRELLDSIRLKLTGENFIPTETAVFRAYERSPHDYRVLIIGQDPYPNPDHAIGLAFAVPQKLDPLPPSLKNILIELESDLGIVGADPDIARWQNRGVMLLNRHLTTNANQSGAHFKFGWDIFTQQTVRYLAEIRKNRLVSILWGAKAQQLEEDLANSKIIKSVHPSPLSSYRGFFGSKPFSRSNQLLIELGEQPIDWS
jgi:uracil-DNA glycosylase